MKSSHVAKEQILPTGRECQCQCVRAFSGCDAPKRENMVSFAFVLLPYVSLTRFRECAVARIHCYCLSLFDHNGLHDTAQPPPGTWGVVPGNRFGPRIVQWHASSLTQ